MNPPRRWSCLDAARRHDPRRRVPFLIDTAHGLRHVGSVARARLPALGALGEARLQVGATDVRLSAPQGELDALLAALNRKLHAAGLVPPGATRPMPSSRSWARSPSR